MKHGLKLNIARGGMDVQLSLHCLLRRLTHSPLRWHYTFIKDQFSFITDLFCGILLLIFVVFFLKQYSCRQLCFQSFITVLCMCVCEHVHWGVCNRLSESNFCSWYPPSTLMCVPGIEVMLPGLLGKHLYPVEHLTNLVFSFKWGSFRSPVSFFEMVLAFLFLCTTLCIF